MIPASEILQLSKQAFWDIDKDKLNYKSQSDYIIRKVFEYGTWNDILEITSYYGTEKIINVLISSPYLKESTLFFVSLFFNIPRNKFACYTTKQFHPVH